MKNKANILTGLIITGALVFGFVLISFGGKVDSQGTAHLGTQTITDPTSPNDLLDDDVVLGDANAPVTLVEFGDYQCTFCTKFFKETEPVLIEKYVNTGKLKIIFRDLPINGRESQNAAEAAQCAGEQGKYWEYHDRLYNERRGYGVGVFVEKNLVRFAKDLELNIEQFNQCYDSGKFRQEIAKDARDAARYGARGTPNFFLNGRQIVGAQPLSVFETLIEQALIN